MSGGGGDKFADIFGECTRSGVVDVATTRSISNSSTSNAIFSFKLEEYDYGFANRGFLGGDDEQAKSPSPKTTSSTIQKLNTTMTNATYNPYDHSNTKHPSSFWGTIFHMIFLSAGSPVLLIPSKFTDAGFLAGSVVIVSIFVFYTYTMKMVLWSAHEICKLKRVSTVSYANLVYEAFDAGPPFIRKFSSAARLLISCIFIVGWYCGCVLIYLLIAQNVQTICTNWLHWNLSLHDWMLIIFVPILLLGLIRKLKFLEPCSSVGFVCNLFSILMVLYYCVTDTSPWKGENVPNWSMNKVPIFVGVILVNINITGLIISLKNEMKHPQKFDTPCGVMTIAYSIILASYFFFSLFFGLKYGTDLPQNAILVIPSSLVLSLISLILYAVGLYLLFPLLMYVPLDVIWNDVLGERQAVIRHKLVWEYILRVCMVALSLVVAYINPNITFFVSLTGTVGSSIDSIMFPALIQTLVEWKVGERDKRFVGIAMKNLIIFCLGLGMMVAGISDCVNEF